MKLSKKKVLSLSLFTAFILHTNLLAEDQTSEKITTLDEVSIIEKRENRESKGATGLNLDIKNTPQSISVLGQKDLAMQGATSSNQALELMTGIDVQQYETNRSVYNSRGYQIQLTQIDGKGTTNDYASVLGEQDTFMFEKIELIRGANGLLTGVGNASGTINYVRKKPTNKDEGMINLSAGSYSNFRGAVDYNKVLTEDGTWAARVIAVREDKESHIRDLENERTSLYTVVDGQIGENGILSMGASYQKNDQDSPTWGALTLNYLNGGQADFPVSSSTSANWTYWNSETKNAFIEYSHLINDTWEINTSYNWNRSDSESKLLYGYTNSGGLNDDNTGLIGWPYAGFTEKEANIFDINVNGDFEAFGNNHTLLAGISYTDEENTTYSKDALSGGFLGYGDFTEYNGNTYAEPTWGDKEKRGEGSKKLTRLYAASRIQLTDKLHTIVGANAIKLDRQGSSIYGNVSTGTEYPVLKEISPYFGLTYDVTEDTLLYASYSNIFQNQDNADYDGNYLDPMEGVSYEVGVKSEFFDKRLLTTFALFAAEQKGLATAASGLNADGQTYYEGKDVDSKGFEVEATGRISNNTRVSLGLTHLKLTGVDGESTSHWIPRTTVNASIDTKLNSVPGLVLGVNGKWKSDAYQDIGAKQDAYFIANAFGSYEINKKTSVRVNVNNLFDKKYLQSVQYGGIYGSPRTAQVTLEYKF